MLTSARTRWILVLLAAPAAGQKLVTIVPGEEPLGWYGMSIALIGDQDGDDLSDYAVGAPGEDDSGPDSGNVRVHSGATGKLLYLVRGEAANDGFGRSVLALDDVDGDQHLDWVSGAPSLYGSPGVIEARSGRTGEVLFRIEGGPDQYQLGYTLRPAGDHDGDGLADFLSSAYRIQAVGFPREEQLLLSGRDGTPLAVFPSESQQWRIATGLGLDDLDQDGVPELALGYLYPAVFSPQAWRVDIVSGSDGTVLHSLSDPQAGLGLLLAALDDLDGDGYRDLAVSNKQLTVWTYSTVDGTLLHAITAPSGERLGFNMIPTGDLSGDGIGDLAIERYRASGLLPTYYGPTQVGIHSGVDGTLISEFEVSSTLVGWQYYQGTALAGAEDLDGDGSRDLVVGFPGPTIPVAWPPRWGGEVRFHSLAGKGLSADRNHMVLDQPGQQQLTLSVGVQYAGAPFLVLGSASGTAPPTLFKGALLPLAADPYFHLTASHPGAPPLIVQYPVIDEFGNGYATYAWQGSDDRSWLGVTLHHAALVLAPSGHPLVSNPVPLVFELSHCDVRNPWVLDCDGNGVSDECDVQQGTLPDCNANGTPDLCDIAAETSHDCDFSRIPDECEEDCNQNGVHDSCDIALGTSLDCNRNGIPDECIQAEQDCNGNGYPDACDIAVGASLDCNGNGIPDECIGWEQDCNSNGYPDACDIAAGLSEDCNANGVPDECSWEVDLNGNGLPDECEPDLVWYVDDDAPGDPGPGDPLVSDPLEDGSPEHPFDTITEAVAASAAFNTVLLADGVYQGPGNKSVMPGRPLTYVAPGGPASCAIDGGGQGFAFKYVWDQSLFRGITFRDFAGDAISGGGPIRFQDCVFERCGRGIVLKGPLLAQADASNLIENCTFLDCYKTACVVDGSCEFRNCVFLRNQGLYGGALNLASLYGALRIVRGCTFLDNQASGSGADIYSYGVGTLHVESSILWGGQAPAGNAIATQSTTLVRYSAVEGGSNSVVPWGSYGGEIAYDPSNIELDPQFTNPAAGDVHLAPGSPCIDAGDPLFEGRGQKDIDGEPRVQHGRVDMGADEVPLGGH